MGLHGQPKAEWDMQGAGVGVEADFWSAEALVAK